MSQHTYTVWDLAYIQGQVQHVFQHVVVVLSTICIYSLWYHRTIEVKPGATPFWGFNINPVMITAWIPCVLQYMCLCLCLLVYCLMSILKKVRAHACTRVCLCSCLFLFCYSGLFLGLGVCVHTYSICAVLACATFALDPYNNCLCWNTVLDENVSNKLVYKTNLMWSNLTILK